MAEPSVTVPLFPSIYALMIFFAISVIGIIMALKNRQFRLRKKDFVEKKEDDKLRDIIADEKKLRETKMRPDIKPQDQGSPQPYPQIDKDNIDNLMDKLKEDKDD